MAFKPTTFKVPPQAPAEILRINKFRGLNLSATETQIDQNESPDMLNLVLDTEGALDKRFGYARIYTTSLGAGQINGLHLHKKADGTTVFLIHHGTTLYTQSGSAQPVSLYASMANAKSKSFAINGKTYIQDGTNYLVYDGTTVSAVTPYIPTLTISRPPAGGGTVYEDFNLLGAGFKDSFSGNGTATAYQLSLTNLDATTVTATVDGVAKVEGTDFTVNRTTGVVTFTTAPASGTNNVIITAYKTQTGFADRIKQCTFFVLFGGANDTRVFWSGNPNYKNWMWRSGLYDPTYAPENGFYKVGSDAEKIQGFAKQYDYVVIEKETQKWVMHYELNSGVASFPIRPLNDQVGTLAPETIQIIENNPVSVSKMGAYGLNSSNVRDERNVQHISNNIDKRLLAETNLQNAISVDFDKKYILVINNYAYVYDYRQGVWYLWDNIPASCFLEIDGYLYFGSNTAGLVYKFKKAGEINAYSDDGVAINAYWKSKIMSFDADEYLKTVGKVFFSLKPASNTSASLYYITDKTSSTFVKTVRMDLFNYATFDYSKMSYVASMFPQEVMSKVKAKKIVYFQLVLQNNNAGESMGILSIGIQHQTQRLVK